MTTELPRLNSVEYGYLQGAAAQSFPADPAEFRALYQIENSRAPEFRLEGLQALDDDTIRKLSEALRTAVIEDPSQIGELWTVVCNAGYMTTLGGLQ
ncbi:hypothetical protein E7T06_07130 [Deinococcus sp. Arct2-2]|uniref:hypothetical protein n=1 Tax=Deinococcus sp. Arct2-2 TaxID=2568653 RepID=UPI0010A52907|nr:hypothetical protein [Deinococcus sp. Arct2-2]THF70471.1 hypothetical protein E7T06_07130 [Deinococcus sp. Arct2-2]